VDAFRFVFKLDIDYLSEKLQIGIQKDNLPLL